MPCDKSSPSSSISVCKEAHWSPWGRFLMCSCRDVGSAFVVLMMEPVPVSLMRDGLRNWTVAGCRLGGCSLLWCGILVNIRVRVRVGS